MQTVTLGQFIDSQFACEPQAFVVKRASLGLDLVSEAPYGFVEPNVTLRTTEPSPILLISAAGAMGKTMTSMAIAERLGCPRIDLAKVTVGQDSHTGILSRALKMTSFADYSEALDSGKSAMIIDALDEAPIRSGERAFFAFLDSLIEEAKEFEVAGGQIVLLGRPQTIAIIRDWCESSGVYPIEASLESLSLNSALELIGGQIQRLGGSNPEPFAEAARQYWREYLFELGKVILQEPTFSESDWDRVSDFLGYPPVLCAIAPALDSKNYMKSLQDLSKGGWSGSPIAILGRIVEDLLARESEKIQMQLNEVFSDGTENLEFIPNLYSFEEQLSRILGSLGVAVNVTLSASLPESLRGRYEENLETFISDHPFLEYDSSSRPRNVVFSDYLRAVVDSRVGYIDGAPAGPLAGERLLPVGPFYVDFMDVFLRETGNTANGIPAVQSEDYFSGLMESWRSSIPHGCDPFIDFTHREQAQPIISLQLVSGGIENLSLSNVSASVNRGRTFTTVSANGVLTLQSPLSHLSVVSDYGVHISPSGGSITMGPYLYLGAKQVELGNVDEIVLRNSRAEDPLSLSSDPFVVALEMNILGDYRIRSIGTAKATVYWPSIDPRWRQFEFHPQQISGLDHSKLVETSFCIRRILTSFKSTNGVPSVHEDKYSRHIVGRNPLLQAVSAAFVHTGLVRRSNGMIVLDQEKLSSFGISYTSYSQPDWEQKIVDVLNFCLRHDERLVEALRDKKRR